jgi:nicotinamide phosphoribosyltransferase
VQPCSIIKIARYAILVEISLDADTNNLKHNTMSFKIGDIVVPKADPGAQNSMLLFGPTAITDFWYPDRYQVKVFGKYDLIVEGKDLERFTPPKHSGKTLFDNILLMTDSYKVSHIHGYVKGLTRLQSYLESRGGLYKNVLFFGLQYFIKRYLIGKVITLAKIDEAEEFWKNHFGRTDVFPRAAWVRLLDKHKGKLPIRIRAVAEGTIVPAKEALMTIENTDDEFPWLVNYLETLLMQVWYPITIATQEYHTRKNVLVHLENSGDPAGISFKVHDFGYRGVTSPEQAAIGDAAHLVSFMGTDTVAGIELLQKYYGAAMCGFSIPATEHSIMCSFGPKNEVAACENWLNQYPTGLIACVSDTYDIYNACANIWGGVLKDKVMNRAGTLVVRPDSGDYFEVVPKVLEILWDKFGGTVNAKNYKVLDPHVRVIQGDGMNPETIDKLYSHITNLGWSADNLAVGSGGGMLMKVDRDTNKFAIKACAAQVDGQWIDIWKNPITDPGKKSKTGRLELVAVKGAHGGAIQTMREEQVEALEQQVLADTSFAVQRLFVTVFENGELLTNYTLDDVKHNAGII